MNKKPRSPIVVVLGHVDHGKTTLLDYIRNSNVAAKEEGAITQKIGAYEARITVEGYPNSIVTFIDTPGHEAFSKIRSRGVMLADVAILLIDGSESIKPQTVESIKIIQQSKIPFIVALNKSDLPNFNLDKVKKDLLRYEVMTEGFGGTTPVVPISAKNGNGVQDLLEAILFVSDEAKYTYDADGPIEAYVIEVNKTKAGVAVSVIIKNGQIKAGQTVYCEGEQAKVKSLINDRGERIAQVLPSTPFVLLGFNQAPNVGSKITQESEAEGKLTMDEVSKDIRSFFAVEDQQKKLKMIIKADNHGSLEAIIDSLQTNELSEITGSGIGEVTKSDIFLAKAIGAIIINFGQNINRDVVRIAKDEKVIIRSYSLIYKLFEEIEDVLLFYAEKDEKKSRFKGQCKIIANFIVEDQNIAGVTVQTGKIAVTDEIELYRGETLVGTSTVTSIKQKTKSVKEIQKNDEGGLLISPHLDFKVGDMIKSYSI